VRRRVAAICDAAQRDGAALMHSIECPASSFVIILSEVIIKNKVARFLWLMAYFSVIEQHFDVVIDQHHYTCHARMIILHLLHQ